MVYDTVSKQKRTISSRKNGFQAFETDPYTGNIFLAELDENPAIKCYGPNLKLIDQIQGGFFTSKLAGFLLERGCGGLFFSVLGEEN